MKNPIVVLLGGFGNQLFQLAFALERYSDQPFKLETSFGSARLALDGKLDLQNYRLPSNVSVINVGAGRVTRKLLNLALRISIGQANLRVKFGFACAISLLLKIVQRRNSRLVCSSGVGFSELNYRKSNRNDLVLGYFQSARFLSQRTIEVLRNMECAQQIAGYEDYREMAHDQKPIVVHVRLGDYELEKGIGLLPNSYYIDALEVALKEYPDSPIWVFSNDLPKTKERFLDLQFKDVLFIEDNWNSASATFEVMRLGSAFVIANSSFSYWAAMLSKDPNPLVIAPKPWFQGTLSPNAILPGNWKTVPTK
jgi:hypothetical protein